MALEEKIRGESRIVVAHGRCGCAPAYDRFCSTGCGSGGLARDAAAQALGESDTEAIDKAIGSLVLAGHAYTLGGELRRQLRARGWPLTII